MKKIIALVLVILMAAAVSLTASSCKKTPDTIVTEDGTEIKIIPAEDTVSGDDDAEAAPQAPGSSYPIVRGTLTLKEDAEIKDGKLVLYFNEVLPYAEYKDSYIGIRGEDEAESIPAEPSVDDCKEMMNENGDYIGIVLAPSYPIPAGTYDFFVSIGTFVVDTFTYTVD